MSKNTDKLAVSIICQPGIKCYWIDHTYFYCKFSYTTYYDSTAEPTIILHIIASINELHNIVIILTKYEKTRVSNKNQKFVGQYFWCNNTELEYWYHLISNNYLIFPCSYHRTKSQDSLSYQLCWSLFTFKHNFRLNLSIAKYV